MDGISPNIARSQFYFQPRLRSSVALPLGINGGRGCRSETQASPVHAPVGCFVRVLFASPSGVCAARAQYPQTTARRRLKREIVKMCSHVLTGFPKGARTKPVYPININRRSTSGIIKAPRRNANALAAGAPTFYDVIESRQRAHSRGIYTPLENPPAIPF